MIKKYIFITISALFVWASDNPANGWAEEPDLQMEQQQDSYGSQSPMAAPSESRVENRSDARRDWIEQRLDRRRFEYFRQLPPEKQQQLRRRWQNLSPEERQRRRERWQELTPQQRDSWRR